MKNSKIPNIISFNRDDLILGTHREWTMALGKLKSGETYIDVADQDLSGVCDDLSTLKKGVVVKGLWNTIQNQRLNVRLLDLMVEHLNDEIKKDDLCKKLEPFEISFNDWLSEYRELGEAKKLELDKEEVIRNERLALYRANLEEATEHFAGACFTLPAIAGKMGQSSYYTIQVPFKQVVSLFKFNEELVPVQLRAQRQLSEKRAQAIADYILDRCTTIIKFDKNYGCHER